MARSWLVLASALFGLGVLLSADLYGDRVDASWKEQQRLVSLASALNVNIGEQLRASSHMLETLTLDAPSLLQAQDGVARLNKRMELLTQSVIGIRSLLLVDANGVVVSSNSPELMGLNLLNSERYTTIRSGSDPAMLYVSPPFTTPLGTYTVSLGKVLLNAQGQFDGYLLAILSPDYFGVLMKSLLYSPDMRLSVVHGDGKVIYSTQSSLDVRNVDLSTAADSVFNRHTSSGQPGSFTIDKATLTGDVRFYALHSIFPVAVQADKALVVAVSREASAVFANWRKSAIHSAVLFAIITLTVCLGFLAYARRRLAYRQLVTEKEQEKTQANARIAQTATHLAVAHQQLRSRETELADAQRLAKIGSWSWHADTDVIDASPEMCQIFGREHIPRFADQVDHMFPHDAWLQLQQARQTVLQTRQGYDLELPALRADGSHIWVNSRSEPLINDDGVVIGLRGMVQDITERKQAESIAKSERFIRTITDAMPGLVAYFDRNLRCCFANKAYLDWYQMSAEAMMGTALMELLGESLFAVNQPHIEAVLAGQSQQFERFLTKRDGSLGHVLANYIPDTDEYGQVGGFILLVSDIKALRLAEADRQVAASVFENTVEAIMVTDDHGVILSVNPAFTEITGYPAHEAVGQTPRLLRSNRHDEVFHEDVWRQIKDKGQWKGEEWNRRKNGEEFLKWQTITRVGAKDQATVRYISVFHDITEAWQKHERNRHLAFHDALTDLPNRALLLERLERCITLNERKAEGLALMFLDLDRFKVVNDTLGHAVGDALLKTVAVKLQALVRQADTVARLGGDEFVVMLVNPANQDEVEHIAKRIIAAFNEPMQLGTAVAQVGTSIGIAMYPDNGTSAAELLKNADAAMYQAKQNGRNSFAFASSAEET